MTLSAGMLPKFSPPVRLSNQSSSLFTRSVLRLSRKLVLSALRYTCGLSCRGCALTPNLENGIYGYHEACYEIQERKSNPVAICEDPRRNWDLPSVLFRNRVIFVGQPVNSQVAQWVISQLLTLAAMDNDADILIYLNCHGGSAYSVLAIYDCMSWIKPDVGTVGFGMVASHGSLLLAGGEKGKRFAMPNTRIMIHPSHTTSGGHVGDMKGLLNEAVQTRHKIDKMYAALTGQPLGIVQKFTEREYFFSAAEAMEFGLIDGILETLY